MRTLIASLILIALPLAVMPAAHAQQRPVLCNPTTPCTPLGPNFNNTGDTYYSSWGKANFMFGQLYGMFGAGSNLQTNGSVNANDISGLFTGGSGNCLGVGGIKYVCSGGSGTPGGTSGQTQYNNAGSFGGYTPSGDATVVASTGVFTIKGLNGTLLSGLATGILKNTTGTGVPSIAVAADFPTLNQSTTGSAASLSGSLTNCSGGQFALGITSTGASNCGTPAGGTAANPTATISGSAVNGVATTYMRSDAAPALATSGVTAGSYTNANVTVDAYGRVTVAANGSAGGSVAFSGVTAGTNTNALVIGTGGSMSTSGSGTIGATSAPVAGITGLGTGIATALAVNVGTAGAPVINGGAGGTPSALVCTNCTGTAAALNIGGNAATATSATSAGSATTATTATNIAAGTAHQIPYQTGAGATTFFSAANYGVATYGSTGVPAAVAGAAGVLQGSASAIPAFTTTPTLTGTNFSGTAASLNIGGTAANLSGTPALPNGTTATTQTVGDNTTKIATDAFVIANASSSGVSSAAAGGGIVITGTGAGPYTGAITVAASAPLRTVTSSPTVVSTDMAGQINMNVTGGGTLTIPAISSTIFPANSTLDVLNISASTAAISTTPTINAGGGCVTATGIPAGDEWDFTSDGTTLYCHQTVNSSSGSGVTSVAATVPTGFTVTGSPITTSGTLAISHSGDVVGGTKFTVAATGCTPSATTGGATAGTITLAAGPCTSLVVTMNGATGLTAPTGWACDVGDRTTLAAGTWIPAWYESSSTTTTATIPVPAAAGATDVLRFKCTGF